MSNDFANFLVGLAGVGVAGLVAWVWSLWRALSKVKDDQSQLRVEFIEKFPNRDEIDRMDSAIQRIERRTDDIRDTLSEIKAALRWKQDHGG